MINRLSDVLDVWKIHLFQHLLSVTGTTRATSGPGHGAASHTGLR